MSAPVGTVYLLHFTKPYKHARHYVGWASDLNHRLVEHRAGHGARLLEVVQQAGISWTLARTWTGTRAIERKLKQRGGASRYCPTCGIHPLRKRHWQWRELDHIAHRMFSLVDAEWITNREVAAYTRKQLRNHLTNPHQVITPAHLLGWTERTRTMNTLTYTPPYVRADGSVWCIQEDTECGTENECRMVVDTETGLTLFLPDYVINVTADQPASRVTGEPWPLFRWATASDLHSTTKR